LISCKDSVVSKGAGYITSAITSTKKQCALSTISPCFAMDFCRKYEIKDAALRPAEKSNLFFAIRNFTAPTYLFPLSSHRIIKSGATVICTPAIIHSLLVTLGKVQCIFPTLSGKLISMKCLKAIIELATSFFAHTELVWRDCKVWSASRIHSSSNPPLTYFFIAALAVAYGATLNTDGFFCSFTIDFFRRSVAVTKAIKGFIETLGTLYGCPEPIKLFVILNNFMGQNLLNTV